MKENIKNKYRILILIYCLSFFTNSLYCELGRPAEIGILKSLIMKSDKIVLGNFSNAKLENNSNAYLDRDFLILQEISDITKKDFLKKIKIRNLIGKNQFYFFSNANQRLLLFINLKEKNIYTIKEAFYVLGDVTLNKEKSFEDIFIQICETNLELLANKSSAKLLSDFAILNILQQSAQTLLNFSILSENIISKLKTIGVMYPKFYMETLFYRLQFLDKDAIGESLDYISHKDHSANDKKKIEYALGSILSNKTLNRLNSKEIDKFWSITGTEIKISLIQNYSTELSSDILRKSLSDPSEDVQYFGVVSIYRLYPNNNISQKIPSISIFRKNLKYYIDDALKFLDQNPE